MCPCCLHCRRYIELSNTKNACLRYAREGARRRSAESSARQATMRQAMAPHLPSSTQAWLAWADTLDTRITCSVEWVWCCVERDPRGGDPSGVPSQTAKNAEQRTIARGDGDITHSLTQRGEGMMKLPPKRPPSSLATHSCLPVETVPLSLSVLCLLSGLPCISSSRAESCPSTTHEERDHYPGVHRVSRRMWRPIFDSKRSVPPPLP